jgi:hypothetical protein
MSSDQGQQLDLFDNHTVVDHIDLSDMTLTGLFSSSMADTITLESLSNTAPLISITNGGIDPYSFSYTSPNISPSYDLNDITVNNRLSVNGPGADIEINGESVMGMLREIRDRLNILQVSKDMEQEWDDLRVLREQYEAKLAECREKSRAWTALQQMPPPPNV